MIGSTEPEQGRERGLLYQDASACECGEALERLLEFLDSEVAEMDADRLRAHLSACEGCLEAADVEQHIRLLVRRSCRERAPETLRMRVRAQIVVLRGGLAP